MRTRGECRRFARGFGNRSVQRMNERQTPLSGNEGVIAARIKNASTSQWDCSGTTNDDIRRC
jgi:hypothetical protein